MKRLFTLLIAVVLTVSVFAQAPQKMSYQAVIRDNLDHLVTSHSVGIQITILQGSPTGTVVYTETQTPSTNANGLISIEIGGGAGFSSIDWANGTYFLKTEVDPAGGTSYSITGTSQLLSVPYALHSKNAETASDAVKLTGDQTVGGVKTFNSTIIGNISGNAATVTNGVYTTGNQTIDGNKTFTGTTTVQTPVNATDATTKAYVDALLIRIEALELYNGFTDSRDGNNYKVVKLGDQIWMAENLKYLPVVHSNAEFATQGNNSQAGYGVYGYDGSDIATAKSQTNYSTYGVLYNWWAAMDGAGSSNSNPSGVQGVCPTGWHLPSDDEWTTLANYLIANGYNYDGTTTGNKIGKALASASGWTSSSTAGAVGNTDYPSKRNATGFTALPGGYRKYTGTFNDVGDYGYWWSASEDDATNAWYRLLNFSNSGVGRLNLDKEYGFSVRCVRD